MERSKRPVFVIGCHRSGTNLLYDTLLSAGGFAVYRGLIPVYPKLIPRFGTLGRLAHRQRLIATWLRSYGFRASGLEASYVTERVLSECRNGGDFIRINMAEIARRQDAQRWAAYDPDNVLFIPQIKRDLPEALFIHIIRDGRDIALSLSKMGGFRPLPWDRKARTLGATALYWEWMVRTGRRDGASAPGDYFEIHYEELVLQPETTLAALSTFLDHDLNYDRIQRAGLGRVSEPNSSFGAASRTRSGPVNRWKDRLSSTEVAELEALVGGCLREVGYALAAPAPNRKPAAADRLMRAVYFNYLDGKLWLKTSTPAGRLASLQEVISDPVPLAGT